MLISLKVICIYIGVNYCLFVFCFWLWVVVFYFEYVIKFVGMNVFEDVLIVDFFGFWFFMIGVVFVLEVVNFVLVFFNVWN